LTGLLVSGAFPSGSGSCAGISPAAAGRTPNAITTAARAKTVLVRFVAIMFFPYFVFPIIFSFH
jgi:hypothetical protein